VDQPETCFLVVGYNTFGVTNLADSLKLATCNFVTFVTLEANLQ
jgi:hypothetical protein